MENYNNYRIRADRLRPNYVYERLNNFYRDRLIGYIYGFIPNLELL
jgi:hypothetical protein